MDGDERQGVLRVVQLNAGSLLEPEWERRRHEILAWFARLDPDIVCLQEIWQNATSLNTAEWLADNDPSREWKWAFGGHELPTEIWRDSTLRFGSAVLSRWPIDAQRLERLPVRDGSDPYKRFPFELLHVRTAGLDVFSVHLSAAPLQGAERVQQVLAVDALVQSLSDPANIGTSFGPPRSTMPPIVCGDFNAEPDSDEIRFLCSLAVIEGHSAFYQDAWRMAGEGPGYTQDWRHNPIADSMNINRKRIDYVFIGDPFRRAGAVGRVLAAELAFDQPITGIVASDHCGLVVDIQWPNRPTG